MKTDFITTDAVAAFPEGISSIGKKIEYLSTVVMPGRRFSDYIKLYDLMLAPEVHYIDPVHELHGKQLVLAMLEKYVSRVYNDQFRFELLVDEERQAFWRWTLQLKVKRFLFTINGLVHAKIENGKIYYQREYYDPMESSHVIPVFGKFYKRMLQNA